MRHLFSRRCRSSRRCARADLRRARAGDLLEQPLRLVEVGEHEFLRALRADAADAARSSAARARVSRSTWRIFVTAGTSRPMPASPRRSPRRIAATKRRSSAVAIGAPRTCTTFALDIMSGAQAAGRSLLLATITRGMPAVSVKQRAIVLRQRHRPVEDKDDERGDGAGGGGAGDAFGFDGIRRRDVARRPYRPSSPARRRCPRLRSADRASSLARR